MEGGYGGRVRYGYGSAEVEEGSTICSDLGFPKKR